MGQRRRSGCLPKRFLLFVGVLFFMWQVLLMCVLSAGDNIGDTPSNLRISQDAAVNQSDGNRLQRKDDITFANTSRAMTERIMTENNLHGDVVAQDAARSKNGGHVVGDVNLRLKDDITSSNASYDVEGRVVAPTEGIVRKLKPAVMVENHDGVNTTNNDRPANSTASKSKPDSQVEGANLLKNLSLVPVANKQNQNRTVIKNPKRSKARPAKKINQTAELELEKMYYKRSPHVVFPFNHTFILKPTVNPCKTNGSESLAMVIVINSKVTNFQKRTAIRETWGKMATGKPEQWPHGEQVLPPMTLLFFLGTAPNEDVMNKVNEEHDQHGDIVLGDFKDDYKNMTLKSMLCLKYLKLHCLNVPYVMKSDDDMFLNLPYITSYLQKNPLVRSFMGPHNPGSLVARKGKWKMTKDEFPPDVLPPYESGSAYVQTMDLTVELYETAQYIRPIFIDDVFITGIVAKLVGNIHRELQKGFAYGNDKRPQLCDIVLNKKFAQTKCPPDKLKSMWKNLSNPSLIQCPPPSN